MNSLAHENTQHVVVVGAGHAGGSVVAFLRQFGFKGNITLIGDEGLLPYHRPPLSKAWLKGEVNGAGLALKQASFYTEQDVDLELGRKVVGIERDSSSVVLDNGERVSYDYLILATGASARTLAIEGVDAPNVLTLRNAQDAELLRTAIRPGKHLVIVGGGYIGLECAATARFLGAEVTVLERTSRLLGRAASWVISNYLQEYHESRGVHFELEVDISAIDHQSDSACVVLSDGRRIPCDTVLIGVGAIPSVELAATAGLACRNGVIVSTTCLTSDPKIYAIGDMARRHHPRHGDIRLESVPNAMEQAKIVASSIVGRDLPAAEIAWFWSDQYDLKLQIAGVPDLRAKLVVRGDPQSGKFAVFQLVDGVVTAVEAINAPQDFFAGKRWISADTKVDEEKLSNPLTPLADIA